MNGTQRQFCAPVRAVVICRAPTGSPDTLVICSPSDILTSFLGRRYARSRLICAVFMCCNVANDAQEHCDHARKALFITHTLIWRGRRHGKRDDLFQGAGRYGCLPRSLLLILALDNQDLLVLVISYGSNGNSSTCTRACSTIALARRSSTGYDCTHGISVCGAYAFDCHHCGCYRYSGARPCGGHHRQIDKIEAKCSRLSSNLISTSICHSGMALSKFQNPLTMLALALAEVTIGVKI